jgi:dihydrolipoamide dehydrogenase
MVVGDIETGTDLLVIGAGPGGYTAAIRAAKKGVDVTVVDKAEVGGTCLNHGCIPAKALIHAAKYSSELAHWDEIGIHTNDVEVDLEEIMEWKDSAVEQLNRGVEGLFKSSGVEFMAGTARFIDESTVRVEEEHNAENVNFKNCIIATGSRPIEIPGFEFEKENVISSKELLDLEEVPEEIVVIGGGYIGMEAVTKFCKFGATVKVIEGENQVLPAFDQELVSEIRETSACYGDEIYTNAMAKELKHEDGKAVVVAEQGAEQIEVEGDYVLVAAGRTAEPALSELGLENTPVQIEDGFIQVDETMHASDSIMAVGDCVGQPMLAHKAYMEGKVAGDVVAGEPAAMDAQFIPKVIYTDPEVAVVGMTPDEAEKHFEGVKTGRFSFEHSGRALTANKPHGFVRVVAREDNKLLGCQIVGPRASDMIAEATLALEMQAYLEDVAGTIHAHPTFPEAFGEACEDAMDESVHSP